MEENKNEFVIENGILLSCRGSGKVVIPDTVTAIGEKAFEDCRDVEDIILPDSVVSIAKEAFYCCFNLKSIHLPKGLTTIGERAFCLCENLKELRIPATVTSIGSGLCSWCTGLESVVVDPANKRYHSDGNCVIETETKTLIAAADHFTIPTDGSVEHISAKAFDGSHAKRIVLPETIKSIGDKAFFDSGEGLPYCIMIPSSVESIGEDIINFYEHPIVALTEDSYADEYAKKNWSENLWAVVHHTNYFNIRDGRLLNYVGDAEEVTIPDGITEISDRAFVGCTRLKKITIPPIVTSIGRQAFAGCNNLESITLPKDLTSIGGLAFYGCKKLRSILIPSAVNEIGTQAFLGCESLKSLVVENGSTCYHSEGNCLIETAAKKLICACNYSTIPADGSVTTIGEFAFELTGITSITLPDTITAIENQAFAECPNLESVVLPDSVMEMGYRVFYDCEKLKNVTLPSNMTKLADHTFYGCLGLESITLPDSVTIIGDAAFYWCKNLKSISFPPQLERIGKYAFYCCEKLESVTLLNPSVSVGEKAFHGCNSLSESDVAKLTGKQALDTKRNNDLPW